MLGRTHIEPDDVLELLDECGITRHLEVLDPVRLEAVGLPDTQDGGITDADLGRQAPRAPVSGRARRARRTLEVFERASLVNIFRSSVLRTMLAAPPMLGLSKDHSRMRPLHWLLVPLIMNHYTRAGQSAVEFALAKLATGLRNGRVTAAASRRPASVLVSPPPAHNSGQRGAKVPGTSPGGQGAYRWGLVRALYERE
jgi:hypothetical protein